MESPRKLAGPKGPALRTDSRPQKKGSGAFFNFCRVPVAVSEKGTRLLFFTLETAGGRRPGSECPARPALHAAARTCTLRPDRWRARTRASPEGSASTDRDPEFLPWDTRARRSGEC